MSKGLKPDAQDICNHIDQLMQSEWLGSSRKWWPYYIYHFTNIDNAVQILNNGFIYSRNNALNMGLMESDNASPQVIEQTNDQWADYVRLYFRPRTPTQFNNEGFRPKEDRALDSKCPVPIFFLFDAKGLLSRQEVSFSNMSLTKAHHQVFSDANGFKNLPFNLIYHDAAFPPEQRDLIVGSRHAEVIIPNQLDLDDLKNIWCRSEAEYKTLINLLDPIARKKWQKKIGGGKKGNLFFRKWLFIEKVNFDENEISFIFNLPSYKCSPFHAKVIIEEKNTGMMYKWENEGFEDDALTLDLSGLKDPTNYIVKLYFEDQIMFLDEYEQQSDIPF
ncbi:MAG: DarT ssDNA thymidine ADP-ribosyltransferase family protein [Syntrophomonadaceae bacterium]|jgi:hypothetical protein